MKLRVGYDNTIPVVVQDSEGALLPLVGAVITAVLQRGRIDVVTPTIDTTDAATGGIALALSVEQMATIAKYEQLTLSLVLDLGAGVVHEVTTTLDVEVPGPDTLPAGRMYITPPVQLTVSAEAGVDVAVQWLDVLDLGTAAADAWAAVDALGDLLAGPDLPAQTASHLLDTENPHSVTAAQAGAYTTGAVDDLIAEVRTDYDQLLASPDDYAVGDLLYASGLRQLARRAAVAVGSVLLSMGLATAPAWGQVSSDHVDASVATTTALNDAIAGIDLSSYAQLSGAAFTGDVSVAGAGTFDIGTGTFLIWNGVTMFELNGATGQIALGATPQADVGLLLNTPARTISDNIEYERLYVKASGAVGITPGTTSTRIVTARFDEPNITKLGVGTGSVTTAATVYISGAPTEGVSNYALLVESGATSLGGSLAVTGNATLSGPTLSIGTSVASSSSVVMSGDYWFRIVNTAGTGTVALFRRSVAANTVEIATSLVANSTSINIGSAAAPFGEVRATSATIPTLTGAVAVTGALTANGGVIINGGAGAAGTLYKSASSGLVIAGILGSAYELTLFRANLSAAIFRVPVNTSNIEFMGDIYRSTSKVVGARKTGWTTATGTATRTAFATSTVTVAELAERVKALIDDLHATAGHGLIGT